MAGRPSKLTPEIAEQVRTLLLAGNFVDTVCDYIGIDYKTFFNWMKWGERANKKDIEGGYVEFFHTVKKAMSTVEMTTVNEVKQGVFNWQSRAWWLERRHPDKWGNRQKVEHTGKDGKPIIDVDALIDKIYAKQSSITDAE